MVDIFPNRTSVRRLVAAVLVEQHDEWAAGLSTPNVCTPRARRSSAGGDTRTTNCCLDNITRMTHSYTI